MGEGASSILILTLQIPLTAVPLPFSCDPNFCLFTPAAGPVFALDPSTAVHKFNYGMAPFGGYHDHSFLDYPQHYSSPYSKAYYHSAPSAIYTPGRSLGSDLYPDGSGMSSLMITHLPEMEEFWSSHGTPGRPLRRLQPLTTIPLASNLRGMVVSTITHPPRIQETSRPPLHGLQHQSTIPDVPNRGGYGLSTDTPQPQISELGASYGTSGPSLSELQPHLSFPTVIINIYIYIYIYIYNIY